jgi:2-polyprenyl-6-methoxyphenol hydroxylase-like FAD-dependent oxidoreductase
LEPIFQWQKDRVCLIGDAAHATTPNMGQGACQAIEDAYLLGKLLVKEKAWRKFSHNMKSSAWKKPIISLTQVQQLVKFLIMKTA